jgi:hypothetical protein
MVTASDRPMPASVSRTLSRKRSGDWRYGGIGVSGVMSGTVS